MEPGTLGLGFGAHGAWDSGPRVWTLEHMEPGTLGLGFGAVTHHAHMLKYGTGFRALGLRVSRLRV